MATCTTTDILNKKIGVQSNTDLQHNGLISDYGGLDPDEIVKYRQSASMIAEDVEVSDNDNNNTSGSDAEDVDKGIYEDFVNIVGGNKSNNGNADDEIQVPSTSAPTTGNDNTTETPEEVETPSTDGDGDGDNLEIGDDYDVDDVK
jgi:hypothetical protein